MPPFEPAWQTAEFVRARARSARDTVQAALDRVASGDSRLNAFVFVDPHRALNEAALLDERIASGDDPGPLAGVPIGVKDLEPVEGMPWTEGSRVYATRVATRDSVQVARLRAAGAIVIGKTNTPEFGYKGFTVNRRFGPTRNPWNPLLTPGGSSGGSAAAVAGGMVPLATGSDGGGSARIPAAFCGCFGFKPTNGRIPVAGADYPAWGTHTTLGPLARTVRDAARYLDVAAGPHPNDLNALEAVGAGFEAAVLLGPGPVSRVAFSADLGYAAVEPEVARVARAAAARFAAALGAALEEAHPGFEDPMPAWFAIAASGDAALVDRLTPDQQELLEPGFRAFADGGRILATEVAEAFRTRHRLNRTLTAFFERFQLLLTPTCAAPPFPAAGPPPRIIGGRDPGPAGFVPFTYPFNLSGHPAASVPAGFDGAGLPVGLQVVAPRFADAAVLAACAAYEASDPWRFPS